MKFKDDVAWADQEIELQADDASRDFLKFFLEWFTAADDYLAQTQAHAIETEPHGPTILMSDRRDPIHTPVQAMRRALADTEAAYGFLGVEWIGQMLLLAYTHWEHGVMMERDLTIIERRSMEVMAAMKMAELQEQSATL